MENEVSGIIQRKLLLCSMVLSMTFFLVVPSHADLMTLDTITYNLSGIADAEIVSIDPFDSGLVYLNAVNVQIAGTLLISGTLDRHGTYLMGEFVPGPYGYSIITDQTFLSGPELFNFSDVGTITTQGVSPGTPFYPISYNADFTYDFTFNQITDDILNGRVTPTVTGINGPPPEITGMLDNFVDGSTYTGELTAVQATTFVSTVPPISLQVITDGSITVTYDYTPFSEPGPGPAPVPEPTTMLLLVSGLFGIAGVSRKKFKK